MQFENFESNFFFQKCTKEKNPDSKKMQFEKLEKIFLKKVQKKIPFILKNAKKLIEN